MLLLVLAVSVALVVSFLCSIFESVLLSIRPAQVEAMAGAGQRAGELLRDFKARIDSPIAAILIVNTIAHTIGATVAGASYVDVFSESTLWIFTVVFTIAVLLLTEIIPKTLGVSYAGKLATPVAHAIHWLTIVLRPLVHLSEKISRSLRSKKDGPATSLEEIRVLTAIARNEQVVGGRTADIIHGATRLAQLRAVDVMVPRSEVRLISADMSRGELLEFIRSPAYSRYPFSPSGQLDDVSGLVLVKDMLMAMATEPSRVFDWQEIITEPLFVPETTQLNSLLRMFMSARLHMAIVVDEYGDTIGITTLEDVIEELVGEIFDETDRPVDELRTAADGTIEALATVDMRRVCNLLDIDWQPSDEYSTVGGLVTTKLERVPSEGDAIEWSGYRLEVVEASETRAERIHIRALPGNDLSAPEDGKPAGDVQ